MRLLGLTNTYPPSGRGGYAEICADVMEGLAARGHSTTVLTCPADGLPGVEQRDGVTVRRELSEVLAAWRRPRRARRASRSDRRAIARALADGVDAAVVWHLRGIVKPPVRLLHEHGVPVLYMLHDRWVLYERPGSVLVPWARVEPLAVRLLGEPPIAAEGVVCFNSAWLRDEHVRLGWRARDAHVVPCGLPQRMVGHAEESSREPRGARRLLFAGRIDPSKGVEDTLAALVLLPEDVTLSIAGPLTSPGHDGQLRAAASQAGVAGRVRWLGELSRPELVDAFADHDVLVYPSREPESFGLGILEGQAAGLVAVTSAPGGPREFLVDGANCLLHEPGDAAGLAAAVRRLLDDPRLAERLRAAGRETAASMPVARSVDAVARLIAERAGAGA